MVLVAFTNLLYNVLASLAVYVCIELKRKRNFGMRKKEKTEKLKTQAGIGIPKPTVTEVKIVKDNSKILKMKYK